MLAEKFDDISSEDDVEDHSYILSDDISDEQIEVYQKKPWANLNQKWKLLDDFWIEEQNRPVNL